MLFSLRNSKMIHIFNTRTGSGSFCCCRRPASCPCSLILLRTIALNSIVETVDPFDMSIVLLLFYIVFFYCVTCVTFISQYFVMVRKNATREKKLFVPMSYVYCKLGQALRKLIITFHWHVQKYILMHYLRIVKYICVKVFSKIKYNLFISS